MQYADLVILWMSESGPLYFLTTCIIIFIAFELINCLNVVCIMCFRKCKCDYVYICIFA